MHLNLQLHQAVFTCADAEVINLVQLPQNPLSLHS